MTQRQRKLVGLVVLLAIGVAWAAGATLIYERLLTGAPAWVVLAYFVVAGLGWFGPAALAIRWMSAPR